MVNIVRVVKNLILERLWAQGKPTTLILTKDNRNKITPNYILTYIKISTSLNPYHRTKRFNLIKEKQMIGKKIKQRLETVRTRAI